MRLCNIVPLAASLLLTAASPLAAQQSSQAGRPVLVVADSGSMQRLTLRDGSEIMGRIISVGESSVQFESSLGVTTIATESIVRVKTERGGIIRQGQYYFPNPNETRLIFAPTGRMLKKGEGYFSDYWIFFPGLSVGLSDAFTIGGGMSIFPGVGFDEQLYYFTPKLGIVQREDFNAAVGALVTSIPFDEGTTAGILYGVGTWGPPEQSFTAGLGYGFENGNLASSPALMAGGEVRASPRISFVSENYLLPGGFLVLSGGLRFMGRGVSVDFALASFNGEGENFCCAPFLGVVWKW